MDESNLDWVLESGHSQVQGTGPETDALGTSGNLFTELS